MTGRHTILRRLRREREITIAVLSKRTKINPSTLSLIERDLFNATPEQRNKLEKVFGKAFSELMRDPATEAA